MLAAKLATVVLLLQLGGQSVAPQQRTAQKASVEGTVLRSASGEPLARAEVKLSRVIEEQDLRFISFDISDPEIVGLPSVITESDGRFALKDLEPGRYRITASRNGYAPQVYGQKAENAPGRIIDLAAGDTVKNIVFRLVQGGVVTGRVRDSNGEPLTGVTVVLMRLDYGEEGRRILFPTEEVETDDRGEYRLFWIKPGRYYLKVKPQGRYGRGKAILDPGLPPTYYPGTLEASNASAIDVGPGSELSAIDIVLPKGGGHWIRGRILESSTGKPPQAINLEIAPRNGLDVRDLSRFGSAQTDYNHETGAFSIRNVLPGMYWLSVSSSSGFDDPISPDRLAEIRTPSDLFSNVFAPNTAARIPIEMPLSDLNDVVINLTPGISIPVRLRVEGRELSSIKELEKARITVVPVNEGDYRESNGLSADGTARIDHLPPGEYNVGVQMPKSADLYVKEILYGRNDVLYDPLHIADQPPSVLAVLLSDKGGRVEGTLTDAVGQPLSGMEVVLIPDLRERKSLLSRVTTDRNGHFVFHPVAPGGYKVFSWEALGMNALYDKDVLAKYEADGKRVQVQESTIATVDVRIIPETRQ